MNTSKNINEFQIHRRLNHAMKVTAQISLGSRLSILFIMICISAQAQIRDSSKLSGPEVKVFHSNILGEDRRIVVQVPANMKKFEAYPVLYVLDGEAHSIMVAGQVQYLSEAYKIIPSLIVVGIENTDRTRDLTPTFFSPGPDGKPDTSANAFGRKSGGGEKFLQFLRNRINSLYRPELFNSTIQNFLWSFSGRIDGHTFHY